MPIIKSAKKRVKITEKRTLRNRMNRSKLRTAIKRFENAVIEKDLEKAKIDLTKVESTIDKSMKKGIIHKNNAARKKSRMKKMFNSISANAEA